MDHVEHHTTNEPWSFYSLDGSTVAIIDCHNCNDTFKTDRMGEITLHRPCSGAMVLLTAAMLPVPSFVEALDAAAIIVALDESGHGPNNYNLDTLEAICNAARYGATIWMTDANAYTFIRGPHHATPKRGGHLNVITTEHQLGAWLAVLQHSFTGPPSGVWVN